MHCYKKMKIVKNMYIYIYIIHKALYNHNCNLLEDILYIIYKQRSIITISGNDSLLPL